MIYRRSLLEFMVVRNSTPGLFHIVQSSTIWSLVSDKCSAWTGFQRARNYSLTFANGMLFHFENQHFLHEYPVPLWQAVGRQVLWKSKQRNSESSSFDGFSSGASVPQRSSWVWIVGCMPVLSCNPAGKRRKRPSDFFTCIASKGILQNWTLLYICKLVPTMFSHTFNICTRWNFWWLLNIDI